MAKSHTGRLLNERADECAGVRVQCETLFSKFFPSFLHGQGRDGKSASVWAAGDPIREHARASAAQLGKSLPRDGEPNHSLLHRAVRASTRRAAYSVPEHIRAREYQAGSRRGAREYQQAGSRRAPPVGSTTAASAKGATRTTRTTRTGDSDCSALWRLQRAVATVARCGDCSALWRL